MMNRTFRIAAAVVLLVIAGAASTACGDIMDALAGGVYRGPPPAQEGISGEEVVIRSVSELSSRSVFIIDRLKYVQAEDPYNINRVAEVVALDGVHQQVGALGLQRGDRVILSTRYESTTKQVGSLSVPDWPGPGRYEYPIGVHSITAIARAN